MSFGVAGGGQWRDQLRSPAVTLSPALLCAATLSAGAVWFAVPTARAAASTSPRPDVGAALRTLRARLPAAVRRTRADNSRRVVDFTQSLVSLLQAGYTPHQAWSMLGAPATVPGWRVTRWDAWSDPPIALVEAAKAPGCAALARVAVCWKVSEQSGAGLAVALQHLVTGLRQEIEVAHEIDGQLSGPRATVQLLLVLPFVALMMGEVLGADPLHALLTTQYGLGCLVVGMALSAVGWRWVERQISAVTPWNTT